MAAKHIRVLLPRNTQADHDVEEVPFKSVHTVSAALPSTPIPPHVW